MKKIKISTTNSYFSAFVSRIVISSAILLSSTIVHATESDKLECLDLSNEILKRQNSGTFFTPTGDRTEYLKDSFKYTHSLEKLDEKEKTKKLKDDLGASLAMQLLIKENLHFDHVIKFTTNGQETEFIYKGNTLIAISSRSKATEEKTKRQESNETKVEDVLILNNCKISKIAHITSPKYPRNDDAEIEVQLVPSAVCKDLHTIKRLALAINDDIDEFKYNCQQQGGTVIKSDTGKLCMCFHTGVTFDPLSRPCGFKKRHLTTPSWKIFEKFISDRGGKWQHGPYTRKTYYEIKKKCSEHEGHWDTPDSEIKNNDKNSSDGPSSTLEV